MSWEQDPWAVPGGAYVPSKRAGGAGGSRHGSGRDGRGGGCPTLWWLLLGVCLAGYAAYSLIWGEHGVLTLRRLAEREAALSAEIAQSQQIVRQLEAEVANIDQTRQRRARLDYDMARDNEIIYQTAKVDSGMNPPPGVLDDAGRPRPDGGTPGPRKTMRPGERRPR